MNFFIESIPLVIWFGLGIYFAGRWVVNPSGRMRRYSKALRVGTLLVFAWMGLFIACEAGNKIGYLLHDGIAHDEGAEMPYDVMHDNAGTHAVVLLFGWVAGFLFWGLAMLMWKRPAGESNKSDPF